MKKSLLLGLLVTIIPFTLHGNAAQELQDRYDKIKQEHPGETEEDKLIQNRLLLTVAGQFQDIDTVKQAFKAGANPNDIDSQGAPLAAQYVNVAGEKGTAIIKAYIDAGLNLQSVAGTDVRRTTEKSLPEDLEGEVVKVGSFRVKGFTLLYNNKTVGIVLLAKAIATKNKDLMEFLLEKGALK